VPDCGHGRAVQVDPIKPTLKAPRTKRLKLKCDEPLSDFAFNLNLRRHTMVLLALALSEDSRSRETRRNEIMQGLFGLPNAVRQALKLDTQMLQV